MFRRPLRGSFALLVLVAACRSPQAAVSVLERFPGHAAALAFDAGGALHVAYVVDGADGRTRLLARRLGAPPVTVSAADEDVELRGENRPGFAMLEGGAAMVAYSVLRPGGRHHPASELRTQVSTDGGATWAAPVPLPDDATPRGHGFTDLVATGDGGAAIAWLDSRAGHQGVQTARLDAAGVPAGVTTVDPLTCQCCRTALWGTEGDRVWLAYRDLAGDDVRNIAYATSDDGGRSFSPRGDVAVDGWRVAGCPESGPRFAAGAAGAVWLAWFDGQDMAIQVARAGAGGSFGPPEVVARRGEGLDMVNHPAIATLSDGRLLVVYEATRDGRQGLEAAVRTASGWSAVMALADDATSPTLALHAGTVRLAYDHRRDDGALEIVVADPLLGLPDP
jgi:hypothetical protein